jgi:hypothetical protein
VLMEFEIIALRDTGTCVRRATAAIHVFTGACHGGIPLLAIPLPSPIRRNIWFPPDFGSPLVGSRNLRQRLRGK